MGDLKIYVIQLDGFEPHEYWAEAPGKARWTDFGHAREAGYFKGRDGFRDYLSRAWTLHLGPAPDLDPRTPKYGVAP